MKPRIGISAYWRDAHWGPWASMPASLVPQGYVDGVRLAGGVALLVPPDPAYAQEPELVLDVLDGLILVGGEDIDPGLYQAAAEPETDPPNQRRDQAELGLVRGALARGMPLLGICRGCQLLNIARGGDLIQHITDTSGPSAHRPRLGVFGRHPVRVLGGQLHGLYGADTVDVHSHHHQAPGRIGQGLVVTGQAPDGIVEALEDPDEPFVIGVLWHPEEEPETSGSLLFRALVAHAAAFHDTRLAEPTA